MARLAISLAGAFIGNMIAPGIGGQIGFALGSAAASALLDPGLPTLQGPKLDDGTITSSAYGTTIPKVFGTISVAGNIIDAGPLVTESQTTEASGKGGPSQKSVTYTQFMDYDVALCDGADGIVRIYANETLIYDASPDAAAARPEWLNFTFYPGSETQDPDATFEALHGAGEVPAYRGAAHVVFKRFKVTEFGTTAVNFRFVVTSNGTESISTWTYAEPTGPSDAALHIAHNRYADLMIGSLYRPAGGTYSGYVAGIDPYSRRIVWRADMPTPATYGEASWVQSCSFENTDDLGIPQYQPDEFVAVYHENEEFTSPRARWVRILYAASGVQFGVVRLTDSSSRPILLSCFTDRAVFYQPISPASVGDVTMRRHQIDTLMQRSTVTVEPPTGYKWGVATNLMAVHRGSLFANRDALIIAGVINTSTSAEGVVVFNDAQPGVNATTWAPSYSAVDEFATADGAFNAATFDALNDCFWVLTETAAGRTVIHKVSRAGVIESSTNWDTEFSIATQAGNSLEVDQTTGLLWIIVGGAAYSWPTYDLTATPTSYSTGLELAPIALHPGSGAMFIGDDDDPTYRQYRFAGLTGGGVSLKSIVEAICDEPGTNLTTSDRAATALAAITVDGFRITRTMERRAALQQLATAYLWDFVPRQGVLTAVLRGGSSATTLDDDDLGAHIAGSNAPALLEISRAAEDRLPRLVGVSFIDATQNFEPGYEAATRQASAGGTESRLEIGVSLSHDDAAQLASVLLHAAHIEAETYEGAAMPSHRSTVIPAAVITATAGGNSYPMRVESANIVEGGVIALRGARHDASVYSDFTVGGTTRDRTRSVRSVGSTLLWPLDLPALREGDLDSGLYLAGSSYSPTWDGAAVLDSADGVAYVDVLTLSAEVSVGYATAALAAPVGRIGYEATGSLTVNMIEGVPESITAAQMHTDTAANYAAVGASGRWEIIRYQTATENADGSWTVSGLHRGLRDTWTAASLHAVGDRFIILNQSAMRRMPIPLADLNAARYLKAVSIGRDIAQATAYQVTPTGRALQCYRPHSLHAVKSGSDWSLSWSRQDRRKAAFLQQPQQSESAASYSVQVLDIGGNVLNTYTTSSTTHTYTSAQQATDWGGSVDYLKWRVAQVSSVKGAGPYVTASAGKFTTNYTALVTARGSLIEFWPQNETVAATMVSHSGTRNGTYYAPADYNQAALTIDGAKSVRTTGAGRFDVSGWASLANVRTIECWIKPDALPSGNAAILVHTDGTNGWVLWARSSGQVVFQLLVSGSAVLTLNSSANMAADTVYHIVAKFSQTSGGTGSLWMNGAQVASGTLSGNASLLTSGQLSSGSVYYSGTSANMDRWHNKLALYSAELTQAEIYADAIAGFGP